MRIFRAKPAVASRFQVAGRSRLGSAAFLFAVIALSSAAVAQPGDSFSRLIKWRNKNLLARDQWVTAVHACLLPNGDILFIGHSRPDEEPPFGTIGSPFGFRMTPTPQGQTLPPLVFVEELSRPTLVNWPKRLDGGGRIMWDTLFCVGHALTQDGRLFTAGGDEYHQLAFDLSDIIQLGLDYATIFDYTTDSWVRLVERMLGIAPFTGQARRWYPTVTRLHDGRMLVTGGADFLIEMPLQVNWNRSVEVYDESLPGKWTVLSSHDNSPLIESLDYPHVFVLPEPINGKDLLMIGHWARPHLMSLSGSGPDDPTIWESRSTNPRPGAIGQVPNHASAAALLPLRLTDGEWGYRNGSVFYAGGEEGTPLVNRLDVYDPLENQWKFSRSMGAGVDRHHTTTILLPDGRMLLIAGHNPAHPLDPFLVQYVDPRDGAFTLTNGAVMPENRGYHVVALMLPDGRVLVGGGNDDELAGFEKANFRYYYPDYWDKARPTISEFPTTDIPLDTAFTVRTTGAGNNIVEIVLIGLGAETHSFDMNQRYVQLKIVETVTDPTEQIHTVQASTSSRWAPPGHYLLFAVNDQLVPSKGQIVRIVE